MQKVEGIVLKANSFEDAKHILHVFSKEFGIISLVVKGHTAKIKRSYSPLLKIEATVLKTQNELWKCKELYITASYPGLRLKLEKLEIAILMIKFLYQILPQKAARQEIYTLFDEHLQHLSSEEEIYAKASSFLMKILYIEGLLPPIATYSEQENELLQKILETPIHKLNDTHCPQELFARVKNCSLDQ